MTTSQWKQPRSDDKPLWDLVFDMYKVPVILTAHNLKLFPLLASSPRTPEEVASSLGLKRRPAELLLTTCEAAGLLKKDRDRGRYALTPLAEDYLLESSPSYYGHYLDLYLENYPTFALIKKSVQTDKPSHYDGKDWVKTHEEQVALGKLFTRSMHSVSMTPATVWPKHVDLKKHKVMLDVGGGSAAHSIGAALAAPHLKAIVLDMPPVCEVANEIIAGFDLSARVKTQVSDYWKDPFPEADLHFYSLIFHDWQPDKNLTLAKKSFDSLKSGGRIVVHEQLYKDDKSGPMAAAAFTAIMVAWTEGQQYSGREVSSILLEAGFVEPEVKPTFGYWSVVTARKP